MSKFTTILNGITSSALHDVAGGLLTRVLVGLAASVVIVAIIMATSDRSDLISKLKSIATASFIVAGLAFATAILTTVVAAIAYAV